MQYQGGKSRIASKLAAVICQWLPNVEEIYEPFCGGGAMSLALAKAGFKVKASDIHEDLILMWQAVMSGTLDTSSVSELEYQRLRYQEPSARRGFVGFGCSFGGRFYRGYARNKNKTDYADQSGRVVQKLRGCTVTFVCRDYQLIPSLAAAYCDPPYWETEPYPGQPPFDYNAFWNWVENRRGPTFISSLDAPLSAMCLWESNFTGQTQNAPQSNVAYRTRTERLFYYPGTFAIQDNPTVPPCPA